MKSFFPDVNVWLALAYSGHHNHPAAAAWFGGLEGIAYFCRVTQLSFLRLITHHSIMGEDTKSQSEAWQVYDGLLEDERISFCFEPETSELELAFRNLTSGQHGSSKQWPDAYLAAFARTAGLVLITFDQSLHRMTGTGSLLLS